jgi:hypothetical protein
MMIRAGREDDLPASAQEIASKLDSGKASNDESKGKEESSKKEVADEKGEENKSAKGEDTAMATNALDVVNEIVEVKEEAEEIQSEVITEPATKPQNLTVGNTNVKVHEIVRNNGVTISSFLNIYMITGFTQVATNDEVIDSKIERNIFEIENSYIKASKPAGDSNFDRRDNVDYSQHYFPIEPFPNQKLALSKAFLYNAARITEAANPRRLDFFEVGGNEKTLMTTTLRPNPGSYMNTAKLYVDAEVFRRNELGEKLFEYCYLKFDDVFAILQDSISPAYFQRLKFDNERLIVNDQESTKKVYPRFAHRTPLLDRNIITGFTRYHANPVSIRMCEESRKYGMEHMLLAPNDKQLSLRNVNDPKVIHSMSMLSSPNAVRFASEYILFLTSSVGSVIKVNIDSLTNPELDEQMNSLAVLSYLCFVRHDLISYQDMVILLSHFLKPFYHPISYTIDGGEVPGIDTIVNGIMRNRRAFRLPPIVKQLSDNSYTYGRNNNTIRTVLERILKDVMRRGGLPLDPVNVEVPIRDYKEPTTSPIKPVGVDAQQLSFGLVENLVGYYTSWITPFRNGNNQGILDAFLFNVIDAQRRQNKMAGHLRFEADELNVAGKTGLAISTSIMSAVPDIRLYPVSPIYNENNPTKEIELNPYDVLSLFFVGITTPYMKSKGDVVGIERAHISLLDENSLFSPIENIMLPADERFRLNMILALMKNVYSEIKAVDPFLIVKKLHKVEECIFRVISNYYDLSNDEKTLISDMIKRKEEFLDEGTDFEYVAIPFQFRDSDTGKFGLENFENFGRSRGLIGCSRLHNQYTDDDAMTAGVDRKTRKALFERGIVPSELNRFNRNDGLTRTRKLFRASNSTIDTFYIPLNINAFRVDVVNNVDSVTSFYALDVAPADDVCMSIDELFRLDVFNHDYMFSIERIQTVAAQMKHLGEIDAKVEYVKVSVEESSYQLIVKENKTSDTFDFEKLQITVDRSQFTRGNKYKLNSPIPVYALETTDIRHLTKMDGINVTGVAADAFNYSFRVGAYITYENIARRFVGREFTKDSVHSVKGKAKPTDVYDLQLYAENGVRVRCANGIILSEMRTVTSRVRENVTIVDKLETRARIN